MALNWRKMEDVKPEDGQTCLVQMKHGVIQGHYNAEEGNFHIYMWSDIRFYGKEWVPIEEVC